MKIIKLILFSVFVIILISFPVNAQYTIYSSYNAGELKIISYSPKWDENKLRGLYDELLNNFHGDEFNFLSAIYLYPDSPYGVNGYYFEDISLENGVYECGENAYIELYNMERTDTIQKAARTLSHEYGHHYSIYNIILKEDKYYTQWAQSQYAAIRGLSDYDVFYSNNPDGSAYRWDAAEIIADDYVQLLGSHYAKLSVDYFDVYEMLQNGIEQKDRYESAFNLVPQNNPYIPLAADVEGLYEYLYSLGGGSVSAPIQSERPQILSIEELINEAKQKEYTISWSEAYGNGPYEYTLIMYPYKNPLVPLPIKTLETGEETTAKLGSAVIKNSDGSLRTLSNSYEGDYEFTLYYKDRDGFIRKSEPYRYTFGGGAPVKEDKSYSVQKQEESDYEEILGKFYENFNDNMSLKNYYYAIIKGTDSFFS